MGLEHLSELLGWSDEIPTIPLHSNQRDGTKSPRFKVRESWWLAVISELENGIRRGDIPADQVPEAEAFMDTYGGRDFNAQHPASVDIERANRVIKGVLGIKEDT